MDAQKDEKSTNTIEAEVLIYSLFLEICLVRFFDDFFFKRLPKLPKK